MKPLPMVFAGLLTCCVFAAIADADAQGISNARDRGGNLVERGAATRSYPVAPMVNNSIPRRSPVGYVAIAHVRTIMIRPRR
jgi:hypothetical protein